MNSPVVRLLYLFPGTEAFPYLGRNLDERSRLCEIQWIDRELFGHKIVVFTQAFYGAASAVLEREVRPGELGEQLVFSGPVDGYETIQVGDAVFQVIGAPDLAAVGLELDLTQLPLGARELELIEEGLVEPGAPVIGV